MAVKLLAHTVNISQNRKITIFAVPENINYFLAPALTPDVTQETTMMSVYYGGSSRHRYPGDPNPYDVPSGTRSVLKAPGRRSAKALPGKNFWLKQIADDQVVEMRQFTYQGAFIDLHSLIEARAKFDLTLYSSRGTPYDILAIDIP